MCVRFDRRIEINDGADARLRSAVEDRLGHRRRALPHGVIDHQHLRLRPVVGPIAIGRQNCRRMLRQITPWLGAIIVIGSPASRIQGPQHRLAVGHHDVGVIGLGLLHDDRGIDLVVEPLAGGVVLAKGVHREQQLLLGHVGGHRLGPMDHRRFEEAERPPPERNLLAVGDDANLPRRRVENARPASRRISCRTRAWPAACAPSTCGRPPSDPARRGCRRRNRPATDRTAPRRFAAAGRRTGPSPCRSAPSSRRGRGRRCRSRRDQSRSCGNRGCSSRRRRPSRYCRRAWCSLSASQLSASHELMKKRK